MSVDDIVERFLRHQSDANLWSVKEGTPLEDELVRLRAENEQLRRGDRLARDGSATEAPPVPQDVYDELLAEEIDELRAENERLRAFIEDMGASYSLPDHEANGVRWTVESGVVVQP